MFTELACRAFTGVCKRASRGMFAMVFKVAFPIMRLCIPMGAHAMGRWPCARPHMQFRLARSHARHETKTTPISLCGVRQRGEQSVQVTCRWAHSVKHIERHVPLDAAGHNNARPVPAGAPDARRHPSTHFALVFPAHHIKSMSHAQHCINKTLRVAAGKFSRCRIAH